MKVLIVDDQEVNRKLPLAILARRGVDAVAVTSCEEALSLLDEDSGFDCLLLDVSLPGMTGTELCHYLRTEHPERKLHIVAYTAHAFADERARIMDAGFDDLLIKPINRDGLLQSLGLALQ
ncbi:response regulator [Paludibacterium paludis]|uniref:Response regulator n=1 Tax=Paludibacterium paludis TaxID=1225769 RepID=A0A918P297_9NEIS|nr:response regulator [Paludibacterium paludis]GGY15334.1 response regulator [Paludibacterium paludis]